MARVCPECGLPLNADDAFCGSCGRPTGMGGQHGAARPPLTDGAARIRIDERSPAEPAAAAVPAPPEEVVREASAAAQRLRYYDLSGEPSFDPLRNKRFGWQLVRRGALFALVGLVLDTVIFLFLLIVAAATRSLAILSLDSIVSILVAIALLIAYLFMPVPALLSQWSRLLGLRAEIADTAYEYIRQAVHRHATPYDIFQPKTLLPPGEGVRHYLELRRGVFACYISCFPHGRDLYIGWSLWIYMSPFRLAMMKIGRQIQDWSGRGNDIHQTLRYESTRATVGAVHACMLEGVDVAIRMLDPEAELLGGETSVSIS
jgi:hypothetical protein